MRNECCSLWGVCPPVRLPSHSQGSVTSLTSRLAAAEEMAMHKAQEVILAQQRMDELEDEINQLQHAGYAPNCIVGVGMYACVCTACVTWTVSFPDVCVCVFVSPSTPTPSPQSPGNKPPPPSTPRPQGAPPPPSGPPPQAAIDAVCFE